MARSGWVAAWRVGHPAVTRRGGASDWLMVDRAAQRVEMDSGRRVNRCR